MTTSETDLRWLDQASNQGGTTWGVPWARGTLKSGEPVALADGRGRSFPLQTEVTALWPDGSVKWTAHSAVIPGGTEGLRIGRAPASPEPSDRAPRIVVTDTPGGWRVDTGAARWTLARSGDRFYGAASAGDRGLLAGAEGLCLHEARSPGGEFGETVTVTEHRAVVETADVEVSGPLRVVVCQRGRHQGPDGRLWLPFVLRTTFYAGQASADLVHTFVYDGDPAGDFLRGLGLRFLVPLAGDDWNRQAAFVGDTGVVRESARGLMMRRDKLHPELYRAQHAGARVDVDAVGDPAYRALVDNLAVWNEWRLTQDSADHWALRKRTGPDCCWVGAWEGRRAGGLAFAGAAGRGGVSVGLRNFWRKHPGALGVSDLARDEGRLTAWFWSPDGPAMDLRHYDVQTHMDAAYEGFQELRATPVGVANTGELRLDLHAAVPSDQELVALARLTDAPARLVCTPEGYHRAGVFGLWAPADRSAPGRRAIEDQLDGFLSFYRAEVEQRGWYGFWNYGDVMHTYDPVRHQWRYDVGGYAWQNSELVPNLWLWLSFLRTGDPETYRMAEAMTRHTSETDVYHLGEYRGLGSRHNVVHWGCGCKEARISMAGLHRVFYFLTGDGRTGEVLDEVMDADYAAAVLDPMRDYFPQDGFAAHVRSGPDWAAFVSNWMTRWERTGEVFYRDKILKGVGSLKAMPFRLASGPTFGYNPDEGVLHYLSDENYSYHMVVAFGAPEVWFELADLTGDEVWKDMLAEFGELYALDAPGLQARTAGALVRRDWDWPMFAVRMVAYAGVRLGRPDLVRRAWSLLVDDNPFLKAGAGPVLTHRADGTDVPRPVDEIGWVSTNWVSQWCLNAIECLALDPGTVETVRQWYPGTISTAPGPTVE